MDLCVTSVELCVTSSLSYTEIHGVSTEIHRVRLTKINDNFLIAKYLFRVDYSPVELQDKEKNTFLNGG